MLKTGSVLKLIKLINTFDRVFQKFRPQTRNLQTCITVVKKLGFWPLEKQRKTMPVNHKALYYKNDTTMCKKSDYGAFQSDVRPSLGQED